MTRTLTLSAARTAVDAMLSSLLRLLPGVAANPKLRVDALCAMLLDEPVLRLPSDMPSMLARSIALSAR